jgi:pimeloyl-ACP methyl ester carboxylesterase
MPTTAPLEPYAFKGLRYHRRAASLTGSSETLHFTHATGFHGYTYRPLLERLPANLDVHAVDLRGHGGSRELGDVARFDSWQVYVDDLLAWLDAREEPVILAGHSVGGTVSLLAAAARPEAVSGLLLLEPVLVPWYARGPIAILQALGQMHRHPLAEGAARRKNDFQSKAEALARYDGRGAFATWPREVLECYVEQGFVPSEGGVTLACAPAWESRSFALTPRNPLRAVATLPCPLTLLVGDRGSTCGPAAEKELVRKLPQARVRRVAGASHFLPMEQPDVVLEELARIREAISVL